MPRVFFLLYDFVDNGVALLLCPSRAPTTRSASGLALAERLFRRDAGRALTNQAAVKQTQEAILRQQVKIMGERFGGSPLPSPRGNLPSPHDKAWP